MAEQANPRPTSKVAATVEVSEADCTFTAAAVQLAHHLLHADQAGAEDTLAQIKRLVMGTGLTCERMNYLANAHLTMASAVAGAARGAGMRS